MKKMTLKKISFWFGINLLIGILVPFTYATESYFSLEGLNQVWDDMLYSFMISVAISSSVGYNEALMEKHLPWVKFPMKRFWSEIILVSLLMFISSFIMNIIFYGSFGLIDWSNFPLERIINRSFDPMIVGYVITFFFISRGFLFSWREQAIKAEKLSTEKYKNEAQFLKNQLNPHFLFNSLNVLSSMVYEDADQSAKYIRSLSKFYRYVLEVQNEDLVPLKQELSYSQNYLDLQKTRFGEKSIILIQPELGGKDYYVPPMALQLILENAIKHNSLSEANPLKIDIQLIDDILQIENSKRKKIITEESSGIGLNNIKERYNLLEKSGFTVEDLDDVFRVKMPLIISS